MYSVLRGIVLFVLFASIVGCGATLSSTVLKRQKIGTDTGTLATTADVRVIYARNTGRRGPDGRVNPEQIICAEPSPDIAKIAQSAFGSSAGFNFGVPGGGTRAANASVSSSRAEAAAQLGQRLATIQLLRDGLYRACEAYANGAIDATSYMVMLSRYDDTMVTLLAAELAANSAPSPVMLTGSALSIAGGRTKFEETVREVAKTNEELTTAEQEQKKETASCKQNPDTCDIDKVITATEEVGRLETKLDGLLSTMTAAVTRTQASGGTIEARSDNEAAKEIAQIQRTFIQNPNADALIVACIAALNVKDSLEPGTELTELGKVCRDSRILENAVLAVGQIANRLIDLEMQNAKKEQIEQSESSE